MHKRRRQYFWLVLIAFLLIVAALWPTNYYIESPGEAFPVSDLMRPANKDIRHLYMVTVSETTRPASLAHYLWSYTQKFDSRVPAAELLNGQSSSQYQELQNWYMETSQENAIYCAAKKAGLKPKLKYLGVYVMALQANSSFKGKLQVGDTVIGANHHHFHSVRGMMTYLNQQRIGQRVKIQIIRAGKKRSLSGKIIKLKQTHRKGIGIQLVEHVKVQTKPRIKINARDIGGPSAGLMFTLSAYEIFTHQHLSGGQKIAGTGTIAPNGQVGIIGGVDKKVVAADRAGAKIFFAPTDRTGVKKTATNYAVAKRTARQIHSSMKIVPVKNFDDALRYLKKAK